MPAPSRVAAALAAAVLGVALTPSASSADEVVHQDVARDSNLILPPDERFEVDPAMDREDITVVRIHYGPKRVKLALRFAAMRTDEYHDWSGSFIIHTKSKRHLVFSAGFIEPDVVNVPVDAVNEDSSKHVPCTGATVIRDDVGKRMVMHLPNACIHHAPWIRVGAVSTANDSGDNGTTHIDDGFRDGLITPTGYVLGPRRIHPDR